VDIRQHLGVPALIIGRQDSCAIDRDHDGMRRADVPQEEAERALACPHRGSPGTSTRTRLGIVDL